MTPSPEFTGKTALVTGASRGIGAATAIALAQAGVPKVVVHYGAFEDGARRTLAAVRGAGAEGEILGGNLATTDGIRNLVAALRDRDIDILVNNAGHLVQRASLVEMGEDLYDEIMNLNARSLWFISQAVAPAMIRKGAGVIVNVSSIAARHGGGPGATVYAASKAAVAAMTKGMAKELAPKGIRVNAISPGTVDNYFHEKYSTREMLDGVVRATPAGKLGTNEEMADVIVFLCSEASRYVHGQTIEINGGMFMV